MQEEQRLPFDLDTGSKVNGKSWLRSSTLVEAKALLRESLVNKQSTMNNDEDTRNGANKLTHKIVEVADHLSHHLLDKVGVVEIDVEYNVRTGRFRRCRLQYWSDSMADRGAQTSETTIIKNRTILQR